jgi:hypothetical protein
MTNTHLINCSALPSCNNPEVLCNCNRCQLKIVKHKSHGKVVWDPSKIDFYYTKNQLDNVWMPATMNSKMYAEVNKECNPLNACVLDYLLSNKDLIPSCFYEKIVLFHGTLYESLCDGRRELCVRSLYTHRHTDNFSTTDGIEYEEQLFRLSNFTTRCIVSSAIWKGGA